MNNSSFIFKGYEVDLKHGEAAFHYVLSRHGKTYQFTERISFPPVRLKVNQEVIKRIMDSFLIILGISYWKLYCPKNLELPTVFLTRQQAEFWNTVYTKGLGEFFYKNKIDFRGLVRFPYASSHPEFISGYYKMPKQVRHDKNNKDRSLLLIGGGKDSIVSAELLKKDHKDFTTLIINPFPIHREVATLIGREPIVISRQIDPKLLQLNKQKDIYNGHIPVSAIYALLGLLAAVLYDYRYIFVSNEKSSNYGNVKYLGQMINHQWSKSGEFEKMFSDYVLNFITDGIVYRSILRNRTELEIAKEFIKYDKYFKVFSSCNRNFTIKNLHLGGVVKRHPRGDGGTRWCGKCPKCAFVFTSLAAYLPKEKVVSIFGRNLFEDKSLVKVLKQLLGIEGIKPFECVGTPQEMRQAWALIKKRKEFMLPNL